MLVDQISELIESAEDALLMLDETFGSDKCDHDVNICFCQIHNVMDRLRAALDSLEGRFKREVA